MKKFVSILAACFVTVTTQAQLKVSGRITGAPEGQVIHFVSEDGNTRDSVTMKGGAFSFSTRLKPAADDMFALFLSGRRFPMLLVADNSEIVLESDMNRFPVAHITKGGQQTKWMQEYHLAMKPVFDKVVALNEEAAKISADDEAAKAAFRVKAEAFGNEVVKTGQSFIKTHPKAQASLFLLVGELQNRISPVELGSLYKSLDAAVRNTRLGKAMAAQMAEMTKGMTDEGLAIDFEQKDPDGKSVKLSSFRGKYVLVDFWASWCGPCRAENPNVVATYKKFKDKNFTVLGVSLDKNRRDWLEAITQDKLTWTHVSDLKGWANEAARLYGVTGIPQNFLIDPSGKVIGSNLRGEQLEQKLVEVLQ